jgi:hypothetical protein
MRAKDLFFVITKTIQRNLLILNAVFISAYVLLFRYLPLRDYPVLVYEGCMSSNGFGHFC